MGKTTFEGWVPSDLRRFLPLAVFLTCLAEIVRLPTRFFFASAISILRVKGTRIQVAQILGGTVVFEQIFGLPGVGRFLFDAINQRDYPVIQGINLMIVSLVVVINLGVDAVYALLDPRIRF